MMKILIITPGRLPVPALKGGAVEILIELLLDYNEAYLQYELYVAAVYDEEAEKLSQKYKFSHFYFIPMGKVFSFISNRHLLPYRMLDYYFTMRTVRVLKKQSDTFACTVVQNELVNGYTMRRYIAGNYIYHAHNNTLNAKNKKEKDFLHSCSRIIAISDFLAGQFKNAADLKNVVTVYNGIDTEMFSPLCCKNNRKQLRKRYGIGSEETVVVFAGRLVHEKGIEVLLEAFMMIPEDKNITLLVLGASFFQDSKENAFIKKLKTLCQKKKEKIIFTGYVNHQDMPDYYGMADIGCIPSLWDEPFGLSVVEQMAMELPVITTDAGAIPEMVDSSCGYVFPRDHNLSRHISSAIMLLSEDKELCIRMGKAGRKTVCENFSRQSFCKAWFQAVTWENRSDEVF